jgi:hypothetical protein
MMREEGDRGKNVGKSVRGVEGRDDHSLVLMK